MTMHRTAVRALSGRCFLRKMRSTNLRLKGNLEDIVNHPSHYTDGGIETRTGKKEKEKTVEDLYN